ncbi:hypothetical protein GEV33_000411 [Tenebrio molitor]|uniref:Uncharacterized protein n=1 Tax=Tenebrio molitor TaxID=7067 RepID=A0A8J6LHI7_TENMO|nr:hypothetical protein GEV33_000411 [Tenebrio molitor]
MPAADLITLQSATYDLLHLVVTTGRLYRRAQSRAVPCHEPKMPHPDIRCSGIIPWYLLEVLRIEVSNLPIRRMFSTFCPIVLHSCCAPRRSFIDDQLCVVPTMSCRILSGTPNRVLGTRVSAGLAPVVDIALIQVLVSYHPTNRDPVHGLVDEIIPGVHEAGVMVMNVVRTNGKDAPGPGVLYLTIEISDGVAMHPEPSRICYRN